MDRSLIDQFIERYQLRLAGSDNRYLGICRGVGLDLTVDEDEIHLVFFAPSANVGDEILEKFKGFTNWAETGLPCDWISGRVQDDSSCLISLHDTRIQRAGPERFLKIPEVVAADMHAHGAADPCLCQTCAERPATQAAVLKNVYYFFCGECLSELQNRAPTGNIAQLQPVQWEKALPALLGVVAVGAFGWGVLQEIELMLGFGFRILMFFIAFVWGGIVADYILRRAGGVSFNLRTAVAVAVFVGLLLGNVWGFHATLRMQVADIPFGESWHLYFTVQLRENLGREFFYLAPGILGAWNGAAWLKSASSIKVR